MTEDLNKRGEYIVRKEEERIARNTAKVEAHKENLQKALTALLQQEEVRQGLKQDIVVAARNPINDPSHIVNRARFGSYKNDEEIITGNEFLPWEE